MLTDIGEFIVGAYLQLIEDCDFIDYNVRPPGGGRDSQGELDVIGLNLKTNSVYLCEVTTHICGLKYKTNKETVEKIREKHKRQKNYASRYLGKFNNHKFMFWSPVVPNGYITEKLGAIASLKLIINGEYKKRIEKLKKLAREKTSDVGNPFFRMLQIMEHMKE